MGVTLDLTNVPNNKAIAITMIAISSILGPYWFLFQFFKPIFYKHDTLTLLLLCGSFGLPIFIFNVTTLYTWLGSNAKEDSWPAIAILSSLTSMGPWYIPCTFTIDHHLTSEVATKIAFYSALAGLILVPMVVGIVKLKLKLKRSKHTKINTPAAQADPLPPTPLPENQNDI